MRELYAANVSQLNTHASLPFLIRLMMALESLRSAFRSLKRGPEDKSIASRTDQFITLIHAMGWTGESWRLIKEGITGGLIRKEMLEGKGETMEVWDMITAQSAKGFVKRIYRVRDLFFAHADDRKNEDIVKRVIEQHASGALNEPIWATDGNGEYLESSYGWGLAAFCIEVFDDYRNKTKIIEQGETIGRLIGQTGNLLSQVLAKALHESGLDLTRREVE